MIEIERAKKSAQLHKVKAVFIHDIHKQLQNLPCTCLLQTNKSADTVLSLDTRPSLYQQHNAETMSI